MTNWKCVFLLPIYPKHIVFFRLTMENHRLFPLQQFRLFEFFCVFHPYSSEVSVCLFVMFYPPPFLTNTRLSKFVVKQIEWAKEFLRTDRRIETRTWPCSQKQAWPWLKRKTTLPSSWWLPLQCLYFISSCHLWKYKRPWNATSWILLMQLCMKHADVPDDQ